MYIVFINKASSKIVKICYIISVLVKKIVFYWEDQNTFKFSWYLIFKEMTVSFVILQVNYICELYPVNTLMFNSIFFLHFIKASEVDCTIPN